MPTYDYQCGACEHTWEEFQSMSAKPVRKCPACGRLKAKRIIGPGAGFIFKGSGFYLTDYRSESYKSGAEADRKTQESTPASSGKSETASSKPADPTTSTAKSETKSSSASGKSTKKSGK